MPGTLLRLRVSKWLKSPHSDAGAEIPLAARKKFFLEHGRLAVAAVVRKAAEERAAEKKAALSPIASEEVRQQAQTEGLVSRPERQERE